MKHQQVLCCCSHSTLSLNFLISPYSCLRLILCLLIGFASHLQPPLGISCICEIK